MRGEAAGTNFPPLPALLRCWRRSCKAYVERMGGTPIVRGRVGVPFTFFGGMVQQRSLGLAWSAGLILLACGGSTGSNTGGSGGAAAGGSGGSAASAGSSSGGSGASATGGSSTGGSGTGGAAGTPATGGSSGTVGTPECSAAGECTLFSDCCSCMALAPGESAPTCLADCDTDRCTAMGITDANVACTAGSCNAGIDCTGEVLCDALPPTCKPGEVPSVRNGCWGGCVPATECAEVSGCAECTGSTLCVTKAALLSTSHCVNIPSACQTDQSCDCLGPALCTEPQEQCTQGGAMGISCSCVDC